MRHSPPSGILAVDGGGTRCRVALKQDGMVVKVEAGPANASSDFDGTIAQIRLGLDRLSTKAKLPLEQLMSMPAYLGLAGVVSPEIAQRLQTALPLKQPLVLDDRPAAVRSALGTSDGAIAHCGTGSFLASQIQGKRRIVGGWGQHLGDQASAQWLGRRALAGTLDVVDGLASPSRLSTDILTRFTGSAEIVAFAAQASPMEFGTFATAVTQYAKDGDPLARDLMYQGAAYIADTVTKIGWRSGLALCLTGGLAPQFRPYLPQSMQDALRPPEGDPLTGALELAREFADRIAANPQSANEEDQ